MTELRSEQPQKRSFVVGCLSHIVFTVFTIGLLIGVGYLWFDNYLDQFKTDIPTGNVSQVETSQMQSIQISLNRDSMNQLLEQFLNTEGTSDFTIQWEADSLVAATTVNYNGLNLPVKIDADLVVNEEKYFQIVIESVKVAEIPLPLMTAYEIVAGQLVLPNWLIYHNDKAMIDVDLNKIPINLTDVVLTAAQANLSENEISINVHYDSEQINLFSSLQFE